MGKFKLIKNDINNENRCHTLDTIRGIALISMIIYHTCFDIVYFFTEHSVPSGLYVIWQQTICWTFIGVSGAALNYSKHPIRRSLIVLLAGYILTLGTYIFMREETIIFGVLQCIGYSMLIIGLLKKPLDKINPIVGFIIFFILFGFTKNIADYRTLGFFSLKLINVPDAWYTINLYPLGLPKLGFTSGDYFPLVPWLFLMLACYYLWKLIIEKVNNKKVFNIKIPLITLLGENTLLIYIIHQPIIYGILYLIYM